MKLPNGHIFKPIETHSKYLATDTGFIYSKIRKKFLKGNQNGGGYLKIKLKRDSDGLFIDYYVHRVIAEVFEVEGTGETVDHKNGIPSDNRISNLRYVTLVENLYYRSNTN